MGTWTTITGWLKQLEARGDAWAARKLPPEEYAEAMELDREIKRRFGMYAGYFLGAIVVVAGLVLTLAPSLSLGKALVYAALGVFYAVVSVFSAWYGYRKWSSKPPWKVLGLSMLLMLAGLVVGVWVTSLSSGRSFADLNWDRLGKGVALALAIGLALSALMLGIAHVRTREVRLKAERLQAEADRERLARQSVQAELKMLQAQVEPHFLFNTLSNLRYLVQSGSDDAVPMLDHLIKYLRSALPEIRAEGSTLGREGELVRAYLEIIRIRMGGALEFSIDVPPELAAHGFPPLMLITLVENAVKHGIAPAGRGKIAVQVSREGDRLRIAVEDDGRGLAEPIGQGVGLANIRERLRALFGETARLDLAGREPAGTRASIEVPA